MRLRLKIKRQDGSTYWTEHFSSIESLNAWLAEEQTRFYWDNTWTTEIFELDNQNSETPYEE